MTKFPALSKVPFDPGDDPFFALGVPPPVGRVDLDDDVTDGRTVDDYGWYRWNPIESSADAAGEWTVDALMAERGL